MRIFFAWIFLLPVVAQAQIAVTHTADTWTVRGTKNTVVLNGSDLSLSVRAGAAVWRMAPSGPHDMRVRTGGNELDVRLADAGEIRITPYETGFKTGVKIVLDRFRTPGLRLVLTLCLEGRDEELVA